MATRPVFVPAPERGELVRIIDVEFRWHSGLAPSQKQRSVVELHSAAKAHGIRTPLEVSTKSEHGLGQAFSAFRLEIQLANGGRTSMESAYQAGKRFSMGGPYLDIVHMKPQEARRDERLRASGDLIGFSFDGVEWPKSPTFLFYNWLFIRALRDSGVDASHLVGFDGFTDIEFNPTKSLNTQAHAAAMSAAMQRLGLLAHLQASASRYREYFRCQDVRTADAVQGDLFSHG